MKGFYKKHEYAFNLGFVYLFVDIVVRLMGFTGQQYLFLLVLGGLFGGLFLSTRRQVRTLGIKRGWLVMCSIVYIPFGLFVFSFGLFAITFLKNISEDYQNGDFRVHLLEMLERTKLDDPLLYLGMGSGFLLLFGSAFLSVGMQFYLVFRKSKPQK